MSITNQPEKTLWMEEFGVDASEDQFVLRRQFSKFLVMTSFGMLAGNAWIAVKSLFRQAEPGFPEVAIGRASEIAPQRVKLFKRSHCE